MLRSAAAFEIERVELPMIRGHARFKVVDTYYRTALLVRTANNRDRIARLHQVLHEKPYSHTVAQELSRVESARFARALDVEKEKTASWLLARGCDDQLDFARKLLNSRMETRWRGRSRLIPNTEKFTTLEPPPARKEPK